MKAKIDSAGIKVWSIHLPFSRTLDISVLDEKKRKENVDFMAVSYTHLDVYKRQR